MELYCLQLFSQQYSLDVHYLITPRKFPNAHFSKFPLLSQPKANTGLLSASVVLLFLEAPHKCTPTVCPPWCVDHLTQCAVLGVSGSTTWEAFHFHY